MAQELVKAPNVGSPANRLDKSQAAVRSAFILVRARRLRRRAMRQSRATPYCLRLRQNVAYPANQHGPSWPGTAALKIGCSRRGALSPARLPLACEENVRSQQHSSARELREPCGPFIRQNPSDAARGFNGLVLC